MKFLKFLFRYRLTIMLFLVLSVLILGAYKEAKATEYSTWYEVLPDSTNQTRDYIYTNKNKYYFTAPIDVPAGTTFHLIDTIKPYEAQYGHGQAFINGSEYLSGIWHTENEGPGAYTVATFSYTGSKTFDIYDYSFSKFTSQTIDIITVHDIIADTVYYIGSYMPYSSENIYHQTNEDNDKVAFRLEIGSQPWITFTSPDSNNKDLLVGNQNFNLYTFEGTCPYNGTNRIYFENTDVTGITVDPNGVRPPDNYFNIDCINNTWSTQEIILKGNHQIKIFDNYNWDLTPHADYFYNTLFYNGISILPQDSDIWISSPLDSRDFYSKPPTYTLQPAENWPFRFQYQLATSTNPSTTYFNLFETTSLWATTSPALISGSLSSLASFNGSLETFINTAVISCSANQKYYKATLANSASTTIAFVSFSTMASSTSVMYPSFFSSSTYSASDLAVSAWLKVFNFKSLPIIGEYIERIWNHLKSRFPWGYLDQIWTLWRDSSASGQDSLGFDVELGNDVGLTTTSTLSITLLPDIQNGSPWYGSAYASKFNAIESKVTPWIWIGWGWIYLRIIYNLFKKKSQED
jgi:hypothetical protein